MRTRQTITRLVLIAATLLLAPTVASTLAAAAPNTAAPITDEALRKLKGERVTIYTTANARHPGVLVHFDARTVTVHLGDWKSTTVERGAIRTIYSYGRRLYGTVGRSRHLALFLRSSGPTTQERAQQHLSSAHMQLGLGVVLLSVGLGGAIGAGLGARAAIRRSKRDGGCNPSFSVWSEPEEGNEDRCDDKWRGVGLGVLAVVAGAVAITGLVFTVQGASLAAQLARTIKRYRPTVTIDPARKSYAASVSFGF